MCASAREPKLVGRDAEIGIIDDTIENLAAGRGQVLLIAGEPGIGKSTLAKIAADKARNKDMPVYWGFAWEAGGAPAYWPWTQIVRSLVAEQSVSHESLGRAARLLPESATSTKINEELSPDQQRFQLLESVRALLELVSRTTPYALVLEDLHAADADTLSLLHYVARHVASMPVLVLGTYRDVEARASEKTEGLWLASRDATVINLKRLDHDDVQSYLQQSGHHAASKTLVRELMKTTEGNPLFLTELVGLLSTDPDASFDSSMLPDSVQQVIRQQVSRLPEVARSALHAAAVLGREFDEEALAAMTDIAVSSSLAPALDLGIIEQKSERALRFSHALHRDVLYQDIDANRRENFHLAYAQFLKNRINEGDIDRWTEYATHLHAAGAEHREDAIVAWQNAASRALDRLAFDDAAELLQKAVNAFGSASSFDPLQRCTLLLECANATLLTGRIEDGQKLCRDAFTIARALQNPHLMANAALTWGSAIVVAKIDKGLIAALAECLERLPEDDAANRSMVQARLAGAMQPAPDPSEPMVIAREAIQLARSTGDDEVLYQVLRSAISALMDFASVDERVPLNREFQALATRFGDIPGRFRSNLRLMIDASEAADRKMMDQAIEEAEQLANRIDLPHYLWRAASARAMQATIAGDFPAAIRFVNDAEAHAQRFEDLEAKVTLAIQRFTILIEWDSPKATPLEDIQRDLQYAYDNGMPEAEFFVAPFIAAYTLGNTDAAAQQLIGNQAVIERIFAAGDRFSLGRTGELAVIAGDAKLAERAFRANEENVEECANLGLMGSTWCGPVAYYQGLIATALGRTDDARNYLDKAMKIATDMGAPPYVSRIHSKYAELARTLGQDDVAADHDAQAETIVRALNLKRERGATGAQKPATTKASGPRFTLQRKGDVWDVSFDNESAVLKDSKGLHMLSELIVKPDRDVHVLDLSGGSVSADTGDAGPALDDEARQQYRLRLESLNEQLEEAQDLGDLGKSDALQVDIDFLTRELSRAFGLGGRERKTGSAAERARVNVRRRIKDAIRRVGEQLPGAGRYLENTVKTGSYCKYSPM